MKLTSSQQEVVDAPRSDILISAAAGSGKTMVLVERIASRIESGDLDVRKILLMTFTKSAAANMKDRLERALVKAMTATTDISVRRRLAEQISLLPLTQISTINGFCVQVIKNFGNVLEDMDGNVCIEPNSSVLETQAAQMMLKDAVTESMDRIYALIYRVRQDKEVYRDQFLPSKPDSDSEDAFVFSLADQDETYSDWCESFMSMTRIYGKALSDRELVSQVISMHTKLRSLPNYKALIKGALDVYARDSRDFSKSETVRHYLNEFSDVYCASKKAFYVAKGLLPDIAFAKTKSAQNKNAEAMQQIFDAFEHLDELVKKGADWDGLYRWGQSFPNISLPAERADDDPTKSAFFEALRTMFSAIYMLTGRIPKGRTTKWRPYFNGLCHAFSMPLADIEINMSRMYPCICRFFELVIMSDDLYAQKKRREGGMDFSDQEQFALSLLQIEQVSTYYRDLYDEIYIDEYQDNSKIQDTIVEAFSDHNVFYVGDIKQSIYRFRHARPDLFISRMGDYKDGQNGRLLELNGNFRSTKTILDFVNFVFEKILYKKVGEFDYDHSHKLVASKLDASGAPVIGDSVQVVLIDATNAPELPALDGLGDEQSSVASMNIRPHTAPEDTKGAFDDRVADSATSDGELGLDELGEDTDEDISGLNMEALYVATEIRRLVDLGEASPGDCAVLVQKNRTAAQFSEILNRYGIPAQGPAQDPLFENKVLLLMQNVIRVIDNVRQDYPLTAMMRAPFHQSGFTLDELTQIYVTANEADEKLRSFHDKVFYFAAHGASPLRDRVAAFLDYLSDLRRRAGIVGVAELVEHIYLTTGYVDYLSTLEGSQENIAALDAFRDWAAQFDSKSSGGLYAFVKLTELIREEKKSVEEVDIFAKIRKAVTCTTIHKSKGLEYKYVFVCGLASSFQSPRSSDSIVFDDRIGVASDCVYSDEGYRFTPIDKRRIADAEWRALLAEKLRLFYVAMTRAETRLYLTGTIKHNKNNDISGLEAQIKAAVSCGEDILPSWAIFESKNYLSFLVMVLARRKNLDLLSTLYQPDMHGRCVSILDQSDALNVELTVMGEGEVLKRATALAASASVTLVSPVESTMPNELLSENEKAFSEEVIVRAHTIDQRRHAVYPFLSYTDLPAKITVSEIKRRAPIFSEEENDDTTNDMTAAISQSANGRAVNLTLRTGVAVEGQSRYLSATERGILLHSVLQYLDLESLTQPPSEAQIRSQIDMMIESGMIRTDAITLLEPYVGAITAFAASSLASRLIEAEKQKDRGPYREIPFSMTENIGNSDFCLIQGMIDCWFAEDDGAVLVDYKSDRLSGTDEEKRQALEKRYGSQLEYYARAIERAGKTKVKEKWIWLIPDAKAFLF